MQTNQHSIPQNFHNKQEFLAQDFLTQEFLENEKKFLEKNKLVKITENDNVIIDVPYARNDNFCETKLYSHPFIYCHEDAYQSLKILVENLKKENLKLKIFDGFRPYKVQAFMAEKFPNFVDEGYVSHPIEGIATHVRGIALDITLVKDAEELAMGTKFDEMSPKAHYQTEGLSAEQISNRQLLKYHMIKAGFEPYENEWWHFNLPIFNKNKSGEIIGAIEEKDKKYPKIFKDFPVLCSSEVNEFYEKKTLKYPSQNKSCSCFFYNALNSLKKIFISNAR